MICNDKVSNNPHAVDRQLLPPSVPFSIETV